MRPGWLPTFTILVVGAAWSQAADIRVQKSKGRVNVRAVAAPLVDVLDRMARETGMKVVYDGPPPRRLVTKTLADRTPAAAVTALLEGSGINYAVVLDTTGNHVVRLVITTAPPPPRRAVAPPSEGMDDALEEPPAPDEPERTPRPPVPPRAEPTQWLLPTPTPYPASPFTPQGPGPVLIPFPGSAPPRPTPEEEAGG